MVNAEYQSNKACICLMKINSLKKIMSLIFDFGRVSKRLHYKNKQGLVDNNNYSSVMDLQWSVWKSPNILSLIRFLTILKQLCMLIKLLRKTNLYKSWNGLDLLSDTYRVTWVNIIFSATSETKRFSIYWIYFFVFCSSFIPLFFKYLFWWEK